MTLPARRTAAPLVVMLTMLLAACGSSATDEGAIDVAGEPVASPLSGTYETIDGGQIELTSLEGQDVVLWFWAPW